MAENMERKWVKYENLSKKFSNQSPDYTLQYCSIYKARLKEMENMLMKKIDRKWGTKVPMCKLYNLAAENYDKVIVIGTLFKDQKLKPSILKQIAQSNQLTPQPILSNFTDESDKLFIEDELQRYEILGCLDGKKLVTGITIALLGSDSGNGKFQVEDYMFCNYTTQVERHIINDDVYVMFLSGLDFINHEKFLPNLEMLMHRLGGVLGDIENVSKIVRVIVAGNSISNIAKKHKATISMTSRVAATCDTIEAVKAFDYFLAHLCQYIDLDIMPGENDPSNHILPQKQMHYCMFPESSVYNTLNLVPNPYYCSLEGVKIIGTSGQPIRDIMGYSEIEDPLEALENCLKWSHLAPTAPDTLGCFPYYDKDPFIIDECPHVLFAGNQPSFGTKMVSGKKYLYKIKTVSLNMLFVSGDDGQRVCLISIPEFTKSFEAVILNLRNLECSTIMFDVCN